MESELEKSLNHLRDQVQAGKLVDELHLHKGWEYTRGEIEKMIAAFKEKAVASTSYDPFTQGTIVGAHNALRSLLDTLDGKMRKGDLANAQLESLKSSNQEELNRLGIK